VRHFSPGLVQTPQLLLQQTVPFVQMLGPQEMPTWRVISSGVAATKGSARRKRQTSVGRRMVAIIVSSVVVMSQSLLLKGFWIVLCSGRQQGVSYIPGKCERGPGERSGDCASLS